MLEYSQTLTSKPLKEASGIMNEKAITFQPIDKSALNTSAEKSKEIHSIRIKEVATNSTSKQPSIKVVEEESSQQSTFVNLFNDMNEKAMESMNADEPETSLEYLKKAESYLQNLEKNNEVFEN